MTSRQMRDDHYGERHGMQVRIKNLTEERDELQHERDRLAMLLDGYGVPSDPAALEPHGFVRDGSIIARVRWLAAKGGA